MGAAAAAAGAGTFAAFSDTESSDGNTITAGELDLTVGQGNDFSYSAGNLAPGDTFSVSVEISKSGIDAEEIVISTSTDAGGSSSNLADQLIVDSIDWDVGSVKSGGSPSDVTAMSQTDIVLDATPLNDGSTGTLTLNGTFNEGAGNDYQGASVDISHTFTLYQNTDQS